MKTLEQIITEQKTMRCEDGAFGIKACKESILNRIEIDKKYFNKTTSLYELLGEYVQRVNESVFANGRMVLACWEMINEK